MGQNCIIGRGAYIGSGVVMGDNCKVQNYALVYEPATLGDGVFIGPAVVPQLLDQLVWIPRALSRAHCRRLLVSLRGGHLVGLPK